MTKVVLLYRTDLACGVETRPWCIWIQGSVKVLEDLRFLLLAEDHLDSGGTLELEDEFGSLGPELLFDLPSHPAGPGSYGAPVFTCVGSNRPWGQMRTNILEGVEASLGGDP